MAKQASKKTPLNAISLGELRRQRKRTGLGSASIVKTLKREANAPAPHVIDNWLSGNQRYADLAQFEMVLLAYNAQPSLSEDGTGPDYVAMTDDLRDELRAIHAKSASGYLDAAPQKFTPTQMSHLLSGRTKKLSRVMLEFFRKDALKVSEQSKRRPYPPPPDLDVVGPLPERPIRKYKPRVQPKGVEYIEITPDLHEELHQEIVRTRVCPRLLIQSLYDYPKGLRVSMVQSWHTGKIQSAEKQYFEYVLSQYRKLPNA